jgi:predicted transcriptional regulator
MTTTLRTASPEMPLSKVLDILRVNRISGVPVLEEGNLVGIISLEDIVRAMEKNELAATTSQYMTHDVVTVASYDSIVKAIRIFTEKGLGRLPVVDENQTLVGMITKGDITRGILVALQKDYKEEEVRRYRARHLFEDIISERTTLVLRYTIKAGDFTHVDGPGIPDTVKVFQPGYSTATEQVREMGFGAGMGLVNMKRCVDTIDLNSKVGEGTKLVMRIFIPDQTIGGRRDGQDDESSTNH